MRILLSILILLTVFVTPVSAKELDPISDTPKWITEDCLITIQKIVQHETGDMRSPEVFEFMAEQILHDLSRYKCYNLTRSRWAIGNYPEHKITSQVKNSVLDVTYRWPHTEFPDCNFIGYPGDIPIWAAHGYDTTICYQKTIGKLTVVGVGGCK